MTANTGWWLIYPLFARQADLSQRQCTASESPASESLLSVTYGGATLCQQTVHFGKKIARAVSRTLGRFRTSWNMMSADSLCGKIGTWQSTVNLSPLNEAFWAAGLITARKQSSPINSLVASSQLHIMWLMRVYHLRQNVKCCLFSHRRQRGWESTGWEGQKVYPSRGGRLITWHLPPQKTCKSIKLRWKKR